MKYFTSIQALLMLIATVAAAVAGVGLSSNEAMAQDDLRNINQDTEVRRVAFRGNATFSDDRLQERIFTVAPSAVERWTRPIRTRAPLRWLPFWETRQYPFRPLELQRDVVRLRRFYREQGFLEPEIDYIAQFDEERNRVRVFFTIEEGPPLEISGIHFSGPDGDPVENLLEAGDRDAWLTQRNRIQRSIGDRYTDYQLVRIQDQSIQWLQDRGYAFARTSATVDVDSDRNEVDIEIRAHVGPRGNFADIEIEGLETVERQVVLRSLPFQEGDRFSHRRLIEGQRQLFGLNLFRSALADLPAQAEDSLVTVRFRVREARPRYLSAQTGYSRDRGIALRGRWQHRNFFGGARDFTATTVWETGMGAEFLDPVTRPSTYRMSLALRQPYLGLPRLSGILSPSFLQQTEPAFRIREYGLTTSLIYDFYRFRTVSLQHTFAQASAFGAVDLPRRARFFNKNLLHLSGTFGRADDYFNPRRGMLFRPFAEVAGTALLPSDISYYKLGSEATAYVPVINNVGIGTRLFVGRIWPTGDSRDQDDVVERERFRQTRFYAGGSTDVRGWSRQLLGPVTLQDTTFNDERRYFYRPEGGLSKIAGNLELRMPFPGLGDNWGTVAFLDFGNVWEGRLPLNFSEYKYGTGGGIRFVTPVGPIRLDIAYKLNPDDHDLIPPGPPDAPREPRWQNRFAVYLSIGPAF